MGSGFVIGTIASHWFWQIPINDAWAAINAFQISSSIPLMNIPISSNCLEWFVVFKQISNFDFLPMHLAYDNLAFTDT